jgi:hypothetical protein
VAGRVPAISILGTKWCTNKREVRHKVGDAGVPMPLQNRVSPFGEIIAAPARGLLMGNRGGRLHDDARKLGTRRWTSKAWICCRLEFNDRHRTVWGDGYTELFFLDEVTALAAGHRPCFECRRRDAERFAALFSATRKRARADAMDEVLHAERLDGKAKRVHRRKLDGLPDGAMIALGHDSFAIRGSRLMLWTPAGYTECRSHPHATEADLLTPPAIIAVLAAGYAPIWHPSAG